MINAALGTGLLVNRYYAGIYRAPKLISTFTLAMLCLSCIKDREKFDYTEKFLFQNNLEQNLDTSPMTRNSYKKALKENLMFRQVLNEKIVGLEDKINKLKN